MAAVAILVREHRMSPGEALGLTVRLRDHWLAVANFWLEARRG